MTISCKTFVLLNVIDMSWHHKIFPLHSYNIMQYFPCSRKYDHVTRVLASFQYTYCQQCAKLSLAWHHHYWKKSIEHSVCPRWLCSLAAGYMTVPFRAQWECYWERSTDSPLYLWDSLPVFIWTADWVGTFKSRLKAHIFSVCYMIIVCLISSFNSIVCPTSLLAFQNYNLICCYFRYF